MAAKWNIAKYNRALKAIRKEHPGLSIARARATWKNLSARLGKSASTVDVRKSALKKRGATSSELSKAVKASARQTQRARAKVSKSKPTRENIQKGGKRLKESTIPKRESKAGRPRVAPRLKNIRNLSQWNDLMDMDILTDELDIGAGVDTGKSKEK